MKLTKLEADLVKDIAYSDHASDGNGLAGYIYHACYDMKILRGVMSSLIKKGVASFEYDSYITTEATYGSILNEYQEEVLDEDLSKYSEFDRYMIEGTYYRLINLEFES